MRDTCLVCVEMSYNLFPEQSMLFIVSILQITAEHKHLQTAGQKLQRRSEPSFILCHSRRSAATVFFFQIESPDAKDGRQVAELRLRGITLRFLCSWRSGRGGGLGPGFDGRPVVTWSGGGTFLHQSRRTQVVH